MTDRELPDSHTTTMAKDLARRLALITVKLQLKRQLIKVSEVKQGELTSLAKQLIDEDPFFTVLAQRTLSTLKEHYP